MSRPIVLGVAAVLLFALGFLAANTHVARGVIFPVTSYEADVNKDTRVNVADLGLVASKYGQTAPTATPVPPATPTAIPIGDGKDYVIARNALVVPGTASWFYASDPAACLGGILYLAIKSLGPTETFAIGYFGNSAAGQQAVPTGAYYTYPQTGANTSIEIQSNVLAVVTLEMHCRPALPAG